MGEMQTGNIKTAGIQAAEKQPAEKQEKRGISSAVLKNIAVVTMLIDHIGAVIVIRLLILMQNGMYEAVTSKEAYDAWLGQYNSLYRIYMAMRIIGRFAFPIYCFLLVEGFQRTHDVKKYLGRMFLFALLSEVPFDLALSGTVWNAQYQNVFFTLFLGLLVITGLRWTEQHFWGTQVWKKLICMGLDAVIILAGCALALLLKTDYSFKGVLAIVVLYLFRNSRKTQLCAGVIIFLLMDGLEMIAALSFLIIWFYNGTRGKQKKYFFYFFYPVHLLVLWLICVAMGIAGIPAV